MEKEFDQYEKDFVETIQKLSPKINNLDNHETIQFLTMLT